MKIIGEGRLSEHVRVTLHADIVKVHQPMTCQPVSPVRLSSLAVNVTVGRTLAHE